MASIARWHVRVNMYGDSLAEGVYYLRSARDSRPPSVIRDGTTDQKANIARSLRRAKSQVRKKILSAKLDHLLTLTYRENVTDFNLTYSHFRRFIRLVRRHYKRDWPYVAVPERQSRGAWHWHLAVRGFQDVHLLRKLWQKAIGEFFGNIDVQFKRSLKRISIVKYITKYLSKGFSGNESSHRYYTSKGIDIPVFERAFRTCEEAISFLKFMINPTYIWQSDDALYGWACTW